MQAQLNNWSWHQQLRDLLTFGSGVFSTYFKTWLETGVQRKTGRQRSLLPVPSVAEWDFDVELPKGAESAALLLVNACLAALNVMADDLRPRPESAHCRRRPTGAQRIVQEHVGKRCARFLRELDAHCSGCLKWVGAFLHFDTQPANKYPTMQAEAVDVPLKAGTCDPFAFIQDDLVQAVSSADGIMECLPDLNDISAPCGAQTDEYAKLVLRLLVCGKLRLRREVKGLGEVFCVNKSTPGRQREIWNGAKVSAAAQRPPPPAKLANPSCFVDLEFGAGEDIYMSKRDVQTCFDVLQAPEALQQYFGRPPVTLDQLSRAGAASVDELRRYVVDVGHGPLSPHDKVYPASTVWPMGFSWSSCVAQASTVACCREAGVPDCAFMTMEDPPPCGCEACGVATDDTFFIHRSLALGQERLKKLDTVLEDRGMPKNADKDVTLDSSMTALGCELTVSPPAAEPNTAKLVMLFAALLDLLVRGRASPRALNRLLGVVQWFCLLCRPMFSVFSAVYAFVRGAPDDREVALPEDVRTELVVVACLVPLMGADLGRSFLPMLTACDAAPEYGFGVSYWPCSVRTAASIGLLAERRGDYVQLFLDPDEEPCKDRLGQPHVLPIKKGRFRVAVSAKARWSAHSSTLEAHGLLLATKWLLRTAKHFHRRLVVLIDAKAILGAACKGRSSARTLRGIMRQLGSLLLATNSLLRLVYIPSEHNPADAPSRGRRKRRQAQFRKQSYKTHVEPALVSRVRQVASSVQTLQEVWGPSL